MRTRISVVAVALMLVAFQVFAEGDPNGAGPGGQGGPRGNRGNRGDKVWSGTAGGMNVGYGQTASKLDMLGDSDSWIYTGQLPRSYKMLNLTDEQTKAVEALMTEAKNAWQDMQKKTQEEFRTTRDHTVFQNMQGKIDELKKIYQTRIGDVLTQDQKDLLAKLQGILKERQDKINELYQEVNTKVQELRVTFDEKLAGILTPEQLKQLDDLIKPPVQKTEQGNPAPTNPPTDANKGGDVAF
jgi:hypothetical protein